MADKRPKIDPEELKALILECKKEGEEVYREVRNTWDEVWALCQAELDESYKLKKDWQSRVFVPELGPMVRKAASVIHRLLLRSGNYYDVEAPDLPSQWIDGQRAAIDYHAERMIGDRSADDMSILTLFKEAVECGFTFGIWVLKLWWGPRTRRRIEFEQGGLMDIPGWSGMGVPGPGEFVRHTSNISGLAGRVVDPRQFFFNHDHSWYVEESWTDLVEVQKLAEAGVYDKAQVAKLKETDYATTAEESERLRKLGLIDHPNKFRKRVQQLEFWGDITDRDGQLVLENARVVLANNEFILNLSNLKSPFWHGKRPHIVGGPVRALFRKEGKSIAEEAKGLQRALNSITNMSLDGLVWRLLKLLWANPERFLDPSQLEDIVPGEPLLVADDLQTPPLNEVPFSDVPAGALHETELIRRAMQNSTGVTDFVMGPGPMRRDTTATEVNVKTAESTDQFEGYAREIEETLIEPSIDMARWLMLQFWRDFEDPSLTQIANKYGLPWATNDPAMRLRFLMGNARIRCRGISSWFEKRDRLQRLIQFLEIAGKVPPFLEKLKIRNLMDRVLLNLGIPDVDDLVLTEDEERQQAMMKQLMAMHQGNNPQMAPPPMPGPGAPGGAFPLGSPPGPAQAPPFSGGGMQGLPPELLAAIMNGGIFNA